MRKIILSTAALVLAGAAQAAPQVFTETFDGGDGAGPLSGLMGNFTSVTFAGGTIGNFGGDGVMQLPGTTFMSMVFNLVAPATSVSVDFWASTGTTSTSKPIISLDATSQTAATNVALNVSNPGLNYANPDSGTHYTMVFTGTFAAGSHTLKFDNTPAANGLRIDDITVTAVPEPQAVLLAAFAGLGLMGVRAARRAK
jgi:hypothetical protein